MNVPYEGGNTKSKPIRGILEIIKRGYNGYT